jgi:hypothetical protein
MPDEIGVNSPEDIRYDLAGARKAESQVAEFFGKDQEAVRERALRTPVPPRTRGRLKGPMGRELLDRCAEMTRTRYSTLLYFEERFPENGDYGYLIGPACQILETELDRLLTTPARSITDDMLAVLEEDNRVEILTKWARGEFPTTLGVECLVLLALRRGCENHVANIVGFVTTRFNRRYYVLLTSRQLGASLDAIRTRYRNPVCHGTATFDVTEYEQFVQLVVANRRFVAWDTAGPVPAEPDGRAGVFHHHLRQSLSAGPS